MEEHNNNMSVKEVLRDIFGPKMAEVSEQFWLLHNEDLGDLYRSYNIVRTVTCTRLRWYGHVARMRRQGMYQDFRGESFGGPRKICKDNIK